MSPLLMFVLMFVAIFGGATLAFLRETRKAGGVKPYVGDFPTTNGRIMMSILLSVFAVVMNQLMGVLHATNPGDVRVLPDHLVDATYLFLFGMLGIDGAVYAVKRLTQHKPENGVSGDTATMPVPMPGSTTVQSSGSTTVTTVQQQQQPTPVAAVPAPVAETVVPSAKPAAPVVWG